MTTFPRSPSEIGFGQNTFSLLASAQSRSLALYVQGVDEADLASLVREIFCLSRANLGYGEDIFDQNSIWFVVAREGRLAGTIRLAYPRYGEAQILPLEKGFRLSDAENRFGFNWKSLIEISRLLIPNASAGGNVLGGLISACLIHAYINGVEYAVCTARPRHVKLYTRKIRGIVFEDFKIPYVSPVTGESYTLLSLDIKKHYEDTYCGAEHSHLSCTQNAAETELV